MGDTSVLCICGHSQGHHLGLERKCQSLACMCPYFSIAVTPGDTTASTPAFDPIKKPYYYNRFPNGVEPRNLAGHLTFHLGTALTYIARAGFKGDAAEDIRKAITHLEFELVRLGTHVPPKCMCIEKDMTGKCWRCGSQS